MPITRKQEAARPSGVSLNPDAFAEGGGLLDDADVDIKEAAFVLWDYQGKAPQVPALGVTFIEHTDQGDKEHDQYYSAGDKRFFVPSGDGECLVPVGDKTGIQRTSNCAAFLLSLVNAGFPKEKLDDGRISVITGGNVHVHREAQPKRSGLAQQPREDGREPTILLVSKVNRLPWEGKKAGATPKATTSRTGEGGGPGGSGGDLENELQELIVGFLGDGAVAKAKLAGMVSAAISKDDPNRAAMIALAFRDSFLKSGPWEYSGGKLSMG